MFDEQPDEGQYEDQIHQEFRRVMTNDAAAKHGYDTAKSFGLDEVSTLKATIITLSIANQNLVTQLADKELRNTLSQVRKEQ